MKRTLNNSFTPVKKQKVVNRRSIWHFRNTTVKVTHDIYGEFNDKEFFNATTAAIELKGFHFQIHDAIINKTWFGGRFKLEYVRKDSLIYKTPGEHA